MKYCWSGCADKTRQEIVDLAAGVYSVPASPVFDLGETLQDSQYNERGLFAEFDHPHGGSLTFPRVPFHMSATQPEVHACAVPGRAQ